MLQWVLTRRQASPRSTIVADWASWHQQVPGGTWLGVRPPATAPDLLFHREGRVGDSPGRMRWRAVVPLYMCGAPVSGGVPMNVGCMQGTSPDQCMLHGTQALAAVGHSLASVRTPTVHYPRW
jgi:hypothetical protein